MEHQFKPGVAANPGGRPKFREVSAAMRRLAAMSPEEIHAWKPKTGADVLALAAYQQAQEDSRYMTHFLDRTEGKVPDQVQLESGPQVLRIAIEPATSPDTTASETEKGRAEADS